MTLQTVIERARWMLLAILLAYAPSGSRVTASTLVAAPPRKTLPAASHRPRYLVREVLYDVGKKSDKISLLVLRKFAAGLGQTSIQAERVILPDMDPADPCTDEFPCEEVCFREESSEISHGVEVLKVFVWLKRVPVKKNEDPVSPVVDEDDPEPIEGNPQPPLIKVEFVRERLILREVTGRLEIRQ
jgi:hypothetical protein